MLILLGMVLLASFNILPMFQAAILAAGAMILTRCVSSRIARNTIDWSLLVVIAASFGVGRALEITGAADAIAGSLIGLANNNPYITLSVIYFVTMLFTELITNNGAAALVFPIALATSKSLGVDFMPFVFAMMMAASASFATPIGYQTNLMVLGPGGYRFGDFIRIGLPLNIILWIMSSFLIPMIWKF